MGTAVNNVSCLRKEGELRGQREQDLTRPPSCSPGSVTYGRRTALLELCAFSCFSCLQWPQIQAESGVCHVTKHEEATVSLMERTHVRKVCSGFGDGAIIHYSMFGNQQYTVNTYKHKYTHNIIQSTADGDMRTQDPHTTYRNEGNN